MNRIKLLSIVVLATLFISGDLYAAIIVVKFSGRVTESNNIGIPVGTAIGGQYTYHGKTAPPSINRDGPVQMWLDNALIDFEIWPIMVEKFVTLNGTIGQYDNTGSGDQVYQVMYNLFDRPRHYYYVYFNISGGHFFRDVFRFSDEMHFDVNTVVSEIHITEAEVTFPFVFNSSYSIKVDEIHFDHITPLVPYSLLLNIW